MRNPGEFFAVQKFSAASTVVDTPFRVPTSVFRADTIAVEETADNGNLVLKNFRIFKVGTFEDSMGFENTWEDIHLDQMVAHYRLLADGNFFPNVPVREDHRFSVASIIGYFTDIYRDPDDSSFLDCSFEFTEPEAAEKWRRGTYRSRSLEVGMYKTNKGSVFYPVVMGLAFVDIPAIESLYKSTDKNRQIFVMQDIEETPVSTGQSTAQPAPTEAPQPTSPQPQPAPPQPAPPPAPPSPEPTTQTANHNVALPAPFTFNINGGPTTDFAAVQSYITVLETAAREQAQTNRREFVSGLASSNRILASQIEQYTAHVDSLNAEQFASFRALWEKAPVLPGLGINNHGMQNGSLPSNPSTGDPNTPTELETVTEIVAQHRRSGMPEEKIQKTSSYKTMIRLQNQLAS